MNTLKAGHWPLERENAALVLIDLQAGHLPAIQTLAPAQLRQNAVLLTRIARLYDVPILLTGAKQPLPEGTFLPEITALPGTSGVIERSVVNAWDAPELVRAVEATGRRHLILAGVALEIGVLFPALSALAAGYAVSVVVDAVGTTDPRIEFGAMLQLAQAGASLVSCASVGMALQHDLAAPSGRELLALLGAAQPTGQNPFGPVGT